MTNRRRSDESGGTGFMAGVDRARGGDSDALAELYRDHVRMVRSYFRACFVDDADDLTSEVFVGMIRSLGRFEGDEREFRTWLMTIAHRRRVDHVRRAQHRNHESIESREHLIEPSQSAADLSSIPDQRLVKSFQFLTDDQREVLALRFVADLSLPAVAEITGRNVGSVKSLQNRGLAALRRSMPDQRAADREWVKAPRVDVSTIRAVGA